ncbi:vWA domain-containing protein [uncultured Thiodictyon sp.]|uniref:vWA domain-containing protein n=1 Tax=uncultured Thiodictyon sp. TaxID=1846217 RepID=UPI0025FB7CEB|nr:vWA domain-containing protein [uncultured Thiodictyon sp.]
MKALLARVLPSLLAPALLFTLALAAATAPAAAAREPLFLADKPGLYQRVLTRPAARLLTAPGGAAAAEPELPPLSVLYVYARQNAQGKDWVEVGATPNESQGWVEAGAVIDWRQTLTLAFTSTSNRFPALFFRDHDRLASLLESPDPGPTVDRLRAVIKSGRYPADFPVIAKEPDTYIDPNRQFYLLPILGFEPIYLPSGHETMLLKVATVTLQAGEQELLTPSAAKVAQGPTPKPAAPANPKKEPAQPPKPIAVANLPNGYRAGVVFVIDTTKSMGPYIDRTRTAIRRIYDKLRGSPLGKRLSFGLVAFRSNVEAAPGLEYVSRVVATLQDGSDPATFQGKMAGVEEAKVSSKGFDEDAFAGVQDALEKIDWTGFDARFVVLITDAGALDAKNPMGRTGLSAERLRLIAQEKDQSGGGSKIAIAVLHLLTPAGVRDHEKASRQYRELSRWGDAEDLYFPVKGGSVETFGAQVDALVDALLSQLEEKPPTDRPLEVPAAAPSDPVALKAALVGRAMQLAYLGRETGSRAPRLIEAWVTDRDLRDPSQKTLEVRVMISKNQLSNLQETLQAIFAAGERTQISAENFFDQLRGAAAAMARDPDKVNELQVKRLADVGQVGAWLDGLPYTSQIMNLTQERWLSRSYAEQQEVLDVIEEKIKVYRKIHDETDRWIRLSPQSSPGEAVTTVPLDSLP